jgi:deazaflavin-dependent oxidoreductase (nitroreductase family)
MRPPSPFQRHDWHRFITDTVAAGTVAAVISGAPSTVHAMLSGRDPLEPSLAAGSLLLRDEHTRGRLLAAAVVSHMSLSLGWAVVLAGTLPRQRSALAGAAAGIAIAALDLGLAGRRFERVQQLPTLPQVADHILYGTVVGAVWGHRRRPHRPIRHRGERVVTTGRFAEQPPAGDPEFDLLEADVAAVRVIAAPPIAVFEFLSDLRNHWLLEDRFVALSDLEGDGGTGSSGGCVRLKGPLGISRQAQTRVVTAQAPVGSLPGRLAGKAQIGGGTTGRVSWRIAGEKSGGSVIALAAVVDRASPLDHVLLVIGRWWLQRTFESALLNLDGLLTASSRLRQPAASHQPERSTSSGAQRSRRTPAISKHRISTELARYVANPLMRKALERGIAPPGYALLETTGRKSGLPRRTPVGNGLDGDTFWIVAEHGRKAAYVRNIEANPGVRVKVGRTWRSGTAQLLPDDDPRERQRRIGRRFNAAMVRLMGTELLTVRVDLDPTSPRPTPSAATNRPSNHGRLSSRFGMGRRPAFGPGMKSDSRQAGDD